MNIRIARICLDCDEVHDAQTCPVCASDSFAYISRWVPVPDRRNLPRSVKSEQAETYAQLVNPQPARSLGSKIATGALGLAAITAAGWLWQRMATPDPKSAESSSSKQKARGSDNDGADSISQA